jgi:acyl transferase domain-containing protein/3-hydroxymyristoyl/3-hydroxydecanoyl-(acyl carrier protein) dehydratase
MACLFPGAPDLNTFWQNIVNKVDATVEVPRDRWIVEPDFMYHPDPMPDKAFSKRSCLIHDFKFDPKGIDLDEELLKELDPLHQMVLSTGREALSSCVTPSMNKENIGTVLAAIALPTDASSSITRKILGASFEEKLFGQIAPDKQIRFSREECLASRVTSLPGALLAEGLGLGGGSFTLDAACASSLYAVKFACDELCSFRADAMLAGGVSRPESLYTQVGFSQLRALSPSGRCAPFDHSADGLVVGEGVGMLVLKRLDDALRDQDHIYALIKGIGLSNDMRGNLLAPDSKGQVRAMRSAYADAGWSPQDVDLIECHGAGTPVGDAVELKSLGTLWGESGWSNQQCAIGSVKSMIGHLLTGAGAAGMIKTLLALKNKTLPPSLNFSKPPAKSPLHNSPFRVQTRAEHWIRKDKDTPRRAAVSAFGFGGINSHLLFEEWDPEIENCRLKIADYHSSTSNPQSSIVNRQSSIKKPPVAIIGMASAFGPLKSLKEFQETVFRGESIITKRPEDRWNGCDTIAEGILDGRGVWGGYMNELSLNLREFRIPPNEIPDILLQHLLMLKVSADAMKDAGLPLRQERTDMGACIGIEFDFEATDFHLRWHLQNLVRKWKKTNRPGLTLEDEKETGIWLESLRDAFRPPLTATRTLGALGGVIASRIAREFRFGGPSYVVSNEAASGLKALEIGVRSLQQKETNAVLVGAVDLCGDVRNVITSHQIRPFTRSHKISPFDRSADGTLPGEGAAALVLKRLDRAIKDGDRIYSVIKGIGKAGRGGVNTHRPSKNAYILSLKRCVEDAGISPSLISFFETHGSGNPLEDRVESEALNEFFAGRKEPCALGSVKPNIGHAGAASGLASLVKTSLCLYQEIIPPLTHFIKSGHQSWQTGAFHMPAFPQYWLRDRKDGPRRACTGAMTTDGNCMHIILESVEYESVERIPEKVTKERKRPLGAIAPGLFVVEGDSKNTLIEGLEALHLHVKDSSTRPDPAPVSSEKGLATDPEIERVARSWYLKNGLDRDKKFAISIVTDSIFELEKFIRDAKTTILSDIPKRMNGPGGIRYSPHLLGMTGDIAFVFPGSGNHYVGMGRGTGVLWPEILREMDAVTHQLKRQLIPDCYVPWRTSWEPGWEKAAHDNIISNPLHMIFGQVVHGGVMANLIRSFGITPHAAIGYSLGESAALFAMGAWPDRDNMLKRMLATDLFTTELAGPCNAARKAWGIPMDEDVNWCAAVVNRPADDVRNVIDKWPFAKLLIVNTPDQCVIGGRQNQVTGAIEELGCDAVFLEGVVTVHCDAAAPVADAYKKLHLFPCTPPKDIRFYSCALARSYTPTDESAAASILDQAISGFNFTTLIERAYQDGVRIFLEMGPHASCTGMINRILDKKPHLAVSACFRSEDDYLSIVKFLGTLIAERVWVDLEKLYGVHACAPTFSEITNEESDLQITLIVGGKTPCPSMPGTEERGRVSGVRDQGPGGIGEVSGARCQVSGDRRKKSEDSISALASTLVHSDPHPVPDIEHPVSGIKYQEIMNAIAESNKATADAHKTFLDFSDELTRSFEKTFHTQTRLMETLISDNSIPFGEPGLENSKQIEKIKEPVQPAFSRDKCLDFAIGSVGRVLGPEFAVVDTYNVRVRLPDEPLMLVDRIISVEGEKRSLGSGRVVTEHDVLPDAWYLDGGHAPVCISVEAGQADLFLCSYLGIDHAVKGQRSYRLLDAIVKFHRGLPRPGDIIRYEIDIDHFVRQGDTYLFFFRFEGFIGNSLLISMHNGCAGFFTHEEVRNSGGIILTEEDTCARAGKKPSDWKALVPVSTESYADDAVEALRRGDLAGCFGPFFRGIELAESLRLPGGRMKLIHRILLLDSEGGRYGLGLIRAEADIHPDDWFLTCHFMDDRVMPGTLMYECCAHTLRVFIQRMGWVTAKPGVCYEPVVGVESVLKCRGPVTPETRHVWYEVEIKELGYAPEPYVIADALMYADGQRIVLFKDMSMKMTGIAREEIEEVWEKTGVRFQVSGDKGPVSEDRGQRTEDKGQRSEDRGQRAEDRGQSAEHRGRRKEEIEWHPVSGIQHPDTRIRKPAVFDRDKILAFAVGKPSEAFGDPYEVFDRDRVIARLPGPPYAFLDRIVSVEPEAWALKPGGWIEAEYDVSPDEWYFKADRSSSMPFCVLLEIALQPCGWLAAYLGSALCSEKDLKFRNLGGSAVLNRMILPDKKTLSMRARMTKVSEAGEMIIEHFDFKVLQDAEIVYWGDTYFGFFTKQALARQIGIRGADQQAYCPTAAELQRSRFCEFEHQAPLWPDDPDVHPAPSLAMPAKALLMIDWVETYVRTGGPQGLGFIRGVKEVRPDEWFFKAHFYQDPVWPGSLGIESFLQLVKFMAIDRWKHLVDSHRFKLITGEPHNWIYRGQVIPENKTVEVEAVVTKIIHTPVPTLYANGFLKVDGLYIYQMENFGFRLIQR